MQTTQFLPEDYSCFLAREAFTAIIDLASVYCGEGVEEILAVVSGDSQAADRRIESAVRSHVGRAICVKLADVCRLVAAEHNTMASTISLNEASDYLFSHFTGKERIADLAKFLFRTGELLAEDRQNLHVVKRGLHSTQDHSDSCGMMP